MAKYELTKAEEGNGYEGTFDYSVDKRHCSGTVHFPDFGSVLQAHSGTQGFCLGILGRYLKSLESTENLNLEFVQGTIRIRRIFPKEDFASAGVPIPFAQKLWALGLGKVEIVDAYRASIPSTRKNGRK